MVTGTHIRGVQPASPVLEISERQIEEAGQNNLGDVIRSLPQNFSGGQNPAVANGAGSLNNKNVTGGSSLNLRGLGADATLTLLDGRRMSYGGFGQAVDISAIPLAALDRIEIIADGASAIYGSDAVGGVANVILKPDYSGLSASARAGGATSGGDFQQQYALVGGTKWSSGGFIATFNAESDNSVDAEQRDYTRYLQAPYSLLPSAYTQQALVSGHQDLDGLASLKVDALYSHRKSNQFLYYYETIYSTGTDDTNYTVSPTVTFNLPNSWSVSLNALYGRDRDIVGQSTVGADGSFPTFTKQCYCNTVQSYEADSEGALVQSAGGGCASGRRWRLSPGKASTITI